MSPKITATTPPVESPLERPPLTAVAVAEGGIWDVVEVDWVVRVERAEVVRREAEVVVVAVVEETLVEDADEVLDVAVAFEVVDVLVAGAALGTMIAAGLRFSKMAMSCQLMEWRCGK